MGGANFSENFFDVCPQVIAETMIFPEDDFVASKRFHAPDAIIQKLQSPIWKIHSDYRDTISQIEVIKKLKFILRPEEIIEGCEDFRRGDIGNRPIGPIFFEAAWYYEIYSACLSKFRDLLARASHIEQAYTYPRRRQRGKIYDYDYYSVNYGQIVQSMHLVADLKSDIQDSITTGNRVLECSKTILMAMSGKCYQQGITLTLDPFCRSLLFNCCTIRKMPALPPKRLRLMASSEDFDEAEDRI